MYITYCEEILKLFLTCGLGVVEFLTVEISELENNVHVGSVKYVALM